VEGPENDLVPGDYINEFVVNQDKAWHPEASTASQIAQIPCSRELEVLEQLYAALPVNKMVAAADGTAHAMHNDGSAGPGKMYRTTQSLRAAQLGSNLAGARHADFMFELGRDPWSVSGADAPKQENHHEQGSLALDHGAHGSATPHETRRNIPAGGDMEGRVSPVDVDDASSPVRWLWAIDEAGLKKFDAAAMQCASILEADVSRTLMLAAAGFVVAKEGQRTPLQQVDLRQDSWNHFDKQLVPSGAAFTCIAPLGQSLSDKSEDPAGGSFCFPPGSFSAIDGMVALKTDILQQALGMNTQVLVVLCLVSTEARHFAAARAALTRSLPRTTFVRREPGAFENSESEPDREDDDGSDGGYSVLSGASSYHSGRAGKAGARILHAVLQEGEWQGLRRKGARSQSWNGAAEMRLKLSFDLKHGAVLVGGIHVGPVTEENGEWRVLMTLKGTSKSKGAEDDMILNGEFVRGAAAVCLQGRYRKVPHVAVDTGIEQPKSAYSASYFLDSALAEAPTRKIGNREEGTFCLFPPRPWCVSPERWRQFPLPDRSVGLPQEAGVVELVWADRFGVRAAAVGRAARWLTQGSICQNEMREGFEQLGKTKLLQASVFVSVPDVASGGGLDGVARRTMLPGELQKVAQNDLNIEAGRGAAHDMAPPAPIPGLEPGCVAVVPETTQRRGTFELALRAAAEVGCAAIVVLQVGRPQLPRAVRHRGEEPPSVPCYTVCTAALGNRLPEIEGMVCAVRPAPFEAQFATGWAERLGAVRADSSVSDRSEYAHFSGYGSEGDEIPRSPSVGSLGF